MFRQGRGLSKKEGFGEEKEAGKKTFKAAGTGKREGKSKEEMKMLEYLNYR